MMVLRRRLSALPSVILLTCVLTSMLFFVWTTRDHHQPTKLTTSNTNYHRPMVKSKTQHGSPRSSILEEPKHGVSASKFVYAATKSYIDFDTLHSKHCPYNNCVFSNVREQGDGKREADLKSADVVIFEYFRFSSLPQMTYRIRQNQFWLLVSHECWAYPRFQWKSLVNGQFNGTMSFRPDSELVYPYGRIEELRTKRHISRDYSQGKTKAAFAYVSNCNSKNYDRLELMKALSQYIDVDIFGKCTGLQPCPKKNGNFNMACEAEEHRKYRFYLSFENSLCSNYITEKFWSRLKSDAMFVPVVVGGVNVSEYASQAPPNSFIHAYNFSGVHALGRYLRRLMSDDEAYNQYHAWRGSYKVLTGQNQLISCKLCELANRMPRLSPRPDLMTWWETGPVGHLPYEIHLQSDSA